MGKRNIPLASLMLLPAGLILIGLYIFDIANLEI